MDKKDYSTEFEKFNIAPQSYPVYTDAEAFAHTFTKCSLLKETAISYANNSSMFFNTLGVKR